MSTQDNGTDWVFQSLSSITQPVRVLVSGNKVRYQEDGHDLDLGYVTDKIIVMGLPAEGLEAMYRNPIDDVVKFFREKHGLQFSRIVNLCEERQYDYSKFDYQVHVCPMPDHEVTCLQTIHKFCANSSKWLNTNEENIIAIHCKAGKGRSGMMISCLLIYLGICQTANEALQYFSARRTKQGSNWIGVQSPSQLRYVQYFEKVIQSKIASNIPKPTIYLKKITLDPVFFAFRPSVKIENFEDQDEFDEEEKKRYFTKKKSWTEFRNAETYVISGKPFEIALNNFQVSGDVKLTVFEIGVLMDIDYLSFYFHTHLVPSEGILKLKRNELDIAYKDKGGDRYSDTFKVTLHYSTNKN